MTEKRSPTETLIAAMEEAEKADECLVIMTATDGSFLTLGSTDRKSTRLGMIEMAKTIILSDLIDRSE